MSADCTPGVPQSAPPKPQYIPMQGKQVQGAINTLHVHAQSVRVPTLAPEPAVQARENDTSRALGPHDRVNAQNLHW